MKKLLTKIIPAIIVLFPTIVSAQNVVFVDPNFKAVCVADPSINTNADSEISIAEAQAFTGSIDASSQSISDMTGIEEFTAATGLDCGYNNIVNLDLTYNVNLTMIDCSSNSLATLNVTGLTSLNTLYCSVNYLTCLDLHTNTSLTTVDCGTNNLTSLNLKNGNNPALTTMNAMSAGGMLYCIQVDNPALSVSYPNWFEDTWSTYTLNCGTSPTASFTSNAPVCMGSVITFNNTSTFSNYWIWDFGDGNTSNVQNPSHIYSSAGYYDVKLIAGNCNSSDTVHVYTHQGMSVYGSTSYSGGMVTNGTVVLAPYVPFYTSFDTTLTTTIDAGGFFYFTAVADGNYLLKVFPNNALFPTLISSYYDNDWAWDSAMVVNHGCYFDDFAAISMVELTPTAPGPGVLHGTVVEGIGFGRAQGDPVHGVDIKLGVTGTANIVAHTTTDALGEYTFTNVAYGNYSVFVDIPGLERDSVYDVTLGVGADSLMDLNYLVDSVAIYVLPNIGIEEYEDDPNFRVFPNPVSETATITYAITSNSNVKLDVYNVFGTKVMSLVNTELSPGNYQYHFNSKSARLRSGVYFISLSGDGKTKTRRIVITE